MGGGPNDTAQGADTRAGFVVAVGILGAIGASTCCILPLVLFSLGIGGAWIGRLTALAPYQPVFIALAVGFIGYGWLLAFRSPSVDCNGNGTCTRRAPGILVKSGLWLAAALVVLAAAWPWIIPFLL